MPTLQKPIDSGFGAASTADDVIRGLDMSGKVAIVTGGYSGIGLETARVLRFAGAKVIVPARDHGRAVRTLQGLDIEIESMDLLDPVSIDAFSKRFLAARQPLHVLVNSAGVMATPLVRDTRGFESQFATNHLGHFQLATRLWPALCAASGARVVSVSSWGHRLSPVVFEDPNFERREYNRWSAYGQSKTANILFALTLDMRGETKGVRAFSLHPGAIVDTGLGKYLTHQELRAAGAIDENGAPIRDPAKGRKTVGQGAATSVWCATSPQLNGLGGVYCQDCNIASMVFDGHEDKGRIGSIPLGVMPYAVDSQSADRLWRLSEHLLALEPSAIPF